MFELLFDNLIFPLPRVRECIEFEFTNYGFNITREREIRRLCHFNLPYSLAAACTVELSKYYLIVKRSHRAELKIAKWSFQLYL